MYIIKKLIFYIFFFKENISFTHYIYNSNNIYIFFSFSMNINTYLGKIQNFHLSNDGKEANTKV